jgi:hypothetical protein
MLTLEELKQQHPQYGAVAKNSNYYYQSYMGGSSYKAGHHLIQYLGEANAPGDQYGKRIAATPLDNHVQTTVDIYRSFLFRQLPSRTLSTLVNNPLTEQWLEDVDQDGQSMNSFMKSINDLAMVTGSMWILIDKGSYAVETQAQEIALGLRAYACAYTPQNVLNWRYERQLNGKNELVYVKLIEEQTPESISIACWHKEYVEKYVVSINSQGEWETVEEYNQYLNPLGYIPIVHYAPIRSPIKGVGQSLVADVADQQKMIYNMLSELEQTIRISGHPSLVKTAATEANAGAGAIVTVPEDTDPGLKPYLLQPTAASIEGILATINNCVESIQRMTHTYAVQSRKTAGQSGVAMQTERQLLNAKLADITDSMRETELKMWAIWADWSGIELPADFDIEYADTFDMRDRTAELDYLLKVKSAGINNSVFIDEVNRQIIELTIEDAFKLEEVLSTPTTTTPTLGGMFE